MITPFELFVLLLKRENKRQLSAGVSFVRDTFSQHPRQVSYFKVTTPFNRIPFKQKSVYFHRTDTSQTRRVSRFRLEIEKGYS